MLYHKASELGSSTPVILGICGFIGFFTFITPFLIHFVSKKYVTELEYDESTKEYIATILNFFLMKKKVNPF
jgi:transmembrane protein 70